MQREMSLRVQEIINWKKRTLFEQEEPEQPKAKEVKRVYDTACETRQMERPARENKKKTRVL